MSSLRNRPYFEIDFRMKETEFKELVNSFHSAMESTDVNTIEAERKEIKKQKASEAQILQLCVPLVAQCEEISRVISRASESMQFCQSVINDVKLHQTLHNSFMQLCDDRDRALEERAERVRNDGESQTNNGSASTSTEAQVKRKSCNTLRTGKTESR